MISRNTIKKNSGQDSFPEDLSLPLSVSPLEKKKRNNNGNMGIWRNCPHGLVFLNKESMGQMDIIFL